MQRIVIKVGTNVITRDSGFLNQKAMQSLVQQICALKRKRVEVVLISSGAMAAGRSKVGKKNGALEEIQKRQIFSSVGQIKLMEIYSRLFRKEGFLCAQALVTKEDFRDRRHYLCMRNCFLSLLHDKIIPIVNENDVVAINELMFTDNDELAGLIASMLDVDRLLILTNVDGLFDGDPEDESASLIKEVDIKKQSLERIVSFKGQKKSLFGRGGMHTKCRVASKLSCIGIATHIVNGKMPRIILDLLKGKRLGTLFKAQKKLSGIKKWIAHTEGQEKGKVLVNKGAEELLKDKDKVCSLLPIGIVRILGDFSKGDIIRIQNMKGGVLGYGLAQYSSRIAMENIGKKNKKPFIHYDYLFLF